MNVIASAEIMQAAALVVTRGSPVLVLRDGLVSATDLRLIQALMSCVNAQPNALASSAG